MKKILLLLFLCPALAMAQAPANDDPCGAISLRLKNGTGFCTDLNFSTANATYNNAYPRIGSCMIVAPNDVWFKFTIPAGGSAEISTSGDLNADCSMEVFSGTNCTTLTYINCNDDGNVAPHVGMPRMALTGRAPGEIIYIKIAESVTGSGNYNICVNTIMPLDAVSKIGIGSSVPDSTLDVNGHLLVRGGMRVAGNLKLNAGTPAAGKILTSDATGNSTWKDAPYKINFEVYNTITQTVAASSFGKKLGFNQGATNGIYNFADSMITIPVSGLYEFDLKVTIPAFDPAVGGEAYISLIQQAGAGAGIVYQYHLPNSARPASYPFTFKKRCIAGQKIYPNVWNTTATAFSFEKTLVGNNVNYFRGYLLLAD